MITRREAIRNMAIFLGMAALPEAVIEAAVKAAPTQPQWLKLANAGVVKLFIESPKTNKGLIHLGIPGMNITTGEGVACNLYPGLNVSLSTKSIGGPIDMSLLNCVAERKGDRIFLGYLVPGSGYKKNDLRWKTLQYQSLTVDDI